MFVTPSRLAMPCEYLLIGHGPVQRVELSYFLRCQLLGGVLSKLTIVSIT